MLVPELPVLPVSPEFPPSASNGLVDFQMYAAPLPTVSRVAYKHDLFESGRLVALNNVCASCNMKAPVI